MSESPERAAKVAGISPVVRRLRAMLSRGRVDAAEKLLGDSVEALSTDWFDLRMASHAFTSIGQADTFVDALLEQMPLVLRSVQLSGHLMGTCPLQRWNRDVVHYFRRGLRDQAGPARGHFGEMDQLSQFPRVRLHQQGLLLRVKYGLIAEEVSGMDLAQACDHLADAFAPSEALQNLLWNASRRQSMGREAWLVDLKRAFVADHLCSDVRAAVLREQGAEHLARADGIHHLSSIRIPGPSPEAVQAFEAVRAGGPAVLCTLHSAYFWLTRDYYASCMPEHVLVGRQVSEEGGGPSLSVETARQTVAFAAIKSLRKGQSVLIAADAGNGSPTEGSVIPLLGLPYGIRDGSALIAYESKRPMLWYIVEREGEAWVPRLEPGPQRKQGEKYPQYRDRWLEWLNERINGVLTGEPVNLALRRPLSTLGWRASRAGAADE